MQRASMLSNSSYLESDGKELVGRLTPGGGVGCDALVGKHDEIGSCVFVAAAGATCQVLQLSPAALTQACAVKVFGQLNMRRCLRWSQVVQALELQSVVTRKWSIFVVSCSHRDLCAAPSCCSLLLLLNLRGLLLLCAAQRPVCCSFRDLCVLLDFVARNH